MFLRWCGRTRSLRNGNSQWRPPVSPQDGHSRGYQQARSSKANRRQLPSTTLPHQIFSTVIPAKENSISLSDSFRQITFCVCKQNVAWNARKILENPAYYRTIPSSWVSFLTSLKVPLRNNMRKVETSSNAPKIFLKVPAFSIFPLFIPTAISQVQVAIMVSCPDNCHSSYLAGWPLSSPH